MNDVHERPGAAENDETDQSDIETAEAAENGAEEQQDAENSESAGNGAEDTIRKLRKENAAARVKARETAALARKVHTALVVADGRLVDPDALPFDSEHLTDAEKLSAAIEALTDAKPYLRARKVAGDAGQGDRGSTDSDVSLIGLMRG